MINWKDVAIGSASTLVVTVVGGLVIYYLTREPPPTLPSEKLVFEIQDPVRFQSDTTNLSIQTIRIGNLGDASASDVRGVVEYSGDIAVVDRVVSMSSGAAGAYTLASPGPQALEVSVNILTPGEIVTLSVFLDGSLASPPAVSAKSTKTVASRGELVSLQHSEPSRDARDTAAVLLPILLLLQVPFAVYFSRRFRRRFIAYPESLNNTAFVLLHQGLAEDAAQLLSEAIRSGQADSNVFTNQAVCQAVRGDFNAAKLSLSAGEFFDRSSTYRGVISFNKALIAMMMREEANAKEHLRAAFEREPAEVPRWCRFSRIFQEQIVKFPSLVAALPDPDLVQPNSETTSSI